MKTLIIGASGSGTTTLGQKMAEIYSCPHLDVDDYYWVKTNPPFQKKIDPATRKQHLKEDFEKFDEVFVSGSLVSWGEEWSTVFDLLVFIKLDPKIRLERLLIREKERYGDALSTDSMIRKTSQEFIQWAMKYDDPSFTGRSITVHQNWLNLSRSPVLEIDGSHSLRDKSVIVERKIEEIRNSTKKANL